VAQPDPTYAWKVVETSRVDDVAVTILEMTSQTWLTTKEVNKPLWKHRMVVARPDTVDASVGLLFIGGGSNADTRPGKARPELVQLARATRTVVTELGMVPNQPLIFGKDGKERFEDDLIAYTWDKFMRTGDERWPARLPMTKAAVRAMDTVTEFCASEAGGRLTVDRFVVAGGSKRGWTTWTTAIVDPRVVAISPIVIDVLNVELSMIHHYKAYGFFSPAVGDYVNHKVMDWMGTAEMAALRRIEDPYEYRDRLTLPKLLIHAAGDQFFLPDSSQFYFADLPGPKYLRYIPNADHSLQDSDAMETLLAWQYLIANNLPLPQLDWVHGNDGVMEIRPNSLVEDVILWKVNNPLVRDFRMETIGPGWGKHPVMDERDGVYRVAIDPPGLGWTAYFVEVQYDIGAPTLLKLTTDVRVIPNHLPHPAPTPVKPSGFMSSRRR
jgi:PhoPQ-activated pathogenicity-related protein